MKSLVLLVPLFGVLLVDCGAYVGLIKWANKQEKIKPAQIGSRRVLLHQYFLNWTNAADVCKRLGQQLLAINSARETRRW